jgi:AraC-like DNA-binding protein
VATYLVVEITLSTQRIDSHDTFKIISVFISFYISYISFYGIKQTHTFQKIDLGSLSVEKEFNTNNQTDKVKIQQAIEKINEVFETQRPYLDPDLTITGLSNLCGIPSGQISLAINKGTGKNFYDFINEYRVKEFIKRIDDQECAHLSLLGLAYDCGFRSKSTFNSFFKRYTGFTPSEYKKNLSNKSGKM